jgi:peptidoglycan hydrolase-like protein with peptidoglycan-binding domain
MAQIGVDVASADSNGTPDWGKATTEGHLRFVGLRVAEGMTPDPWYATYRTQLDGRGIPNFSYLFLKPNTASPEDQAKNALDLTGVLNNHYFPLALDVEGDRHGLTAEQWRDWVVRAKQTIEDALGVPCLLYTSRVYWIDPDGMNNLPAPELADCTPWTKYWPYAVRSPAVYDPFVVDQIAPPPAPPPFGNAWLIQQYQGDGIGYPGFRSTVDMNRTHVMRQGDVNDSVKWVQRRLPGLAIDGDFGPLTKQAVTAFQTIHKIDTDGVVGLQTAQLLAWVAPR